MSDSTGLITSAMQQSAVDLGWQAPEDSAVHNIIGLGLPQALGELFPTATEDDFARIRDRYRVNYLAMDRAQPSVLFPKVMATLTQLRDRGHQMAVATGKNRQGLDRILAAMQLEGFFHATRCADETQSKPHPLMLHQLLEELKGRPEEAVMIGDTEYDMDMGRRAGMERIAVSYGAHKIERLHQYEPALCLDCLGGLLDWERAR